MKKGLVIIAAIAAVAVAAFISMGSLASDPAAVAGGTSNPFDAAKNSATNAVVDASGVKTKINAELQANASTIAAATGLTTDQVNEAITTLDIEDWEATTLPENATATSSISGDYSGVQTTITTYDDPSYVTVDAMGQSVTMSIPPSAQSYTGYLAYLGG